MRGTFTFEGVYKGLEQVAVEQEETKVQTSAQIGKQRERDHEDTPEAAAETMLSTADVR
jgi:hypothetical protein